MALLSWSGIAVSGPLSRRFGPLAVRVEPRERGGSDQAPRQVGWGTSRGALPESHVKTARLDAEA